MSIYSCEVFQQKCTNCRITRSSRLRSATIPPRLVRSQPSRCARSPRVSIAGEIVALYPRARHMSAKVRTFIDALVDRFAEERPVL
jgi:DNA-binding transcriptional LysR family regulator